MTDGEFGLFETEISPGRNVRSHYHTTFTESFFVLEGHVRLVLGDTERVAGQGDFAFVPRRGIHGFANDSDADVARMLILFTPGVAREDYFREMVELHQQSLAPTPAQIDAVAARHDQVNIRNDHSW